MKSVDASKIGFYFSLFVVVFFTGVFTGRLQRHDALTISMDGSSENQAKQLAEQTPVAMDTGMQPLFDFNSDQYSVVLNDVLADWLTNPNYREEQLKLLVDPMAGPFDGRQPILKKVIVDSRMVRGLFQPKIPGITTTVENGLIREPLKVGELGIWIERFAVLPSGRLSVAFNVTNHGYISKSVQYLVTKTATGWNVVLVKDE